MGLPLKEVSQFKLPVDKPFTRDEREDVTLLFAGLTPIHDFLMQGALEGLGYKAQHIPTPDNQSLALGKEYCNRGQCNPTYYTVGNLIKVLKKMRDEGVEDIEKKYVYITVGACGPCRFGMYEAEYRKALRDAGFEDLRVLTISQEFEQEDDEKVSGLNRNAAFYIALVKAVMAGDMINELKYKIRPYEIDPGSTEKAVDEAVQILYKAIKNRSNHFMALRKAKKILEKVSVDYSRVKPKIQVIGEFWAQTTEGDGNYRLPLWLEEEGCEVVVQPVSGWIDYTFWYWKEYLVERVVARKNLKEKLSFAGDLTKMKIAEYLFKFYFNLYRAALGFVMEPLPSQKKMAQLGEKYFNTKILGGEGHLEVAKNLLAIKEKKAHLVISVKPFGCMPSTQSDGVQSKVLSDFKEGLFIPIETSGDGEVNVKSRVQMKLFEARERAKEEFSQFLKEMGMSDEYAKKVVLASQKTGLSVRKLPSSKTTTAGNYLFSLSKERGLLRRFSNWNKNLFKKQVTQA